MTPSERQEEIRRAVRREGVLSVEALAGRFAVSAETIRRDLAALAREGSVEKVHGGARRPRLFAEGPPAERAAEGVEAKARIGRRLAALVQPGETLFMDAGTTTLACAEALARVPDLRVVTNSVEIARVLGRAGGTVFLLGGAYGHGEAHTLGPLVVEQLERFQADRAVLTVAGLEGRAGATDSGLEEAQVARAMRARAAATVIVAHGAKFGRRAAFRVCGIEEIDLLLCDAPPPEELAAALAGRVEFA